MDEPILYLQKKKYSGESTVVSMRIPKDMLEDLDKVALESGRTRNEILSLGIDFFLKHIKIVLSESESQ